MDETFGCFLLGHFHQWMKNNAALVLMRQDEVWEFGTRCHKRGGKCLGSRGGVIKWNPTRQQLMPQQHRWLSFIFCFCLTAFMMKTDMTRIYLKKNHSQATVKNDLKKIEFTGRELSFNSLTIYWEKSNWLLMALILNQLQCGREGATFKPRKHHTFSSCHILGLSTFYCVTFS